MIYSIDIEDTDLSIPGCREKYLKNNKELRKYRRENNKVSDLVFSFGQYRRGGKKDSGKTQCRPFEAGDQKAYAEILCGADTCGRRSGYDESYSGTYAVRNKYR